MARELYSRYCGVEVTVTLDSPPRLLDRVCELDHWAAQWQLLLSIPAPSKSRVAAAIYPCSIKVAEFFVDPWCI